MPHLLSEATCISQGWKPMNSLAHQRDMRFFAGLHVNSLWKIWSGSRVCPLLVNFTVQVIMYPALVFAVDVDELRELMHVTWSCNHQRALWRVNRCITSWLSFPRLVSRERTECLPSFTLKKTASIIVNTVACKNGYLDSGAAAHTKVMPSCLRPTLIDYPAALAKMTFSFTALASNTVQMKPEF